MLGTKVDYQSVFVNGHTYNHKSRGVPVKCRIEASFRVPLSFKISSALIPWSLLVSQVLILLEMMMWRSVNILFNRVRAYRRAPALDSGGG
jgi:hypothetical protein